MDIWLAGTVAIAGLLSAGLVPQEAAGAITLTTEAAKTAASDPSAARVLDAARAMDGAVVAGDAASFSAGLAADLVVNTPGNFSQGGAATLEVFKSGRIRYESYDRNIELIQVRKAERQVVLMGQEVVRPTGLSRYAGSTVQRRFTDVWRQEASGEWRLTLRQSTVKNVE